VITVGRISTVHLPNLDIMFLAEKSAAGEKDPLGLTLTHGRCLSKGRRALFQRG